MSPRKVCLKLEASFLRTFSLMGSSRWSQPEWELSSRRSLKVPENINLLCQVLLKILFPNEKHILNVSSNYNSSFFSPMQRPENRVIILLSYVCLLDINPCQSKHSWSVWGCLYLLIFLLDLAVKMIANWKSFWTYFCSWKLDFEIPYRFEFWIRKWLVSTTVSWLRWLTFIRIQNQYFLMNQN